MMQSIILKITCLLSGHGKIILLFGAIIFFGCTKSEEFPYNNEPAIKLIKISHDTIKEYVDVLTISLEYQDGDGDLGFEEPNRFAIFIRDTRLTNFDGFYVGPLAPPGAVVPIEGILHVEFPSLFLFGNGRDETTFFEIKMVDRAGNESNVLTTKQVIISKP